MTTLDELKVGDPVIVQDRRGEALQTIRKLTKLHFVVGPNATKYKRETGYRVGGGVWDSAAIHPATPEDIERLKVNAAYSRTLRELEGYVTGAGWRDKLRALPLERLQQAAALLRPDEETPA